MNNIINGKRLKKITVPWLYNVQLTKMTKTPRMTLHWMDILRDFIKK